MSTYKVLNVVSLQTAKHLVLLCHFDEYELFHGINFKKTLKAPTDFCFALRVG